jgi:hypothetical protein
MAEKDDRRAGSIILNDFALFNKAVSFFDKEIDKESISALNEIYLKWARENSWEYNKNPLTYTDIWINPPEWMWIDKRSFARFYFSTEINASSSAFNLADICGIGESIWGFLFQIESKWFNGKENLAKLSVAIENSATELIKRGWVNEGKGAFFLPVTLPADRLAQAWETQDWSEVVAPLIAAFDQLAVDQAIFDRLLDQAKRALATA